MCLKHWPVTLLNRFLDLLMTGELPVNDTKINNSNRTISHARENNDPHGYCCPGKLKKAQIPPIKPSHLSFNAREYIISACCHMFSPTTNPIVDMITDCTAFRSCSLTRHPPLPPYPQHALHGITCIYMFARIFSLSTESRRESVLFRLHLSGQHVRRPTCTLLQSGWCMVARFGTSFWFPTL